MSVNNLIRWVRASERLPFDTKPKAARQKDEYMSLRVIEGEMVRVAGITVHSLAILEEWFPGIEWLEETDVPTAQPADMATLPVNEVWDLSGIPDDQKHAFVDGMVKITAENFLKVFVMLGLKDGIESGVDNQATGDQFILIFKKLKYPAAKAAEAPSLPVKEVKEETFGGKEVSILDLIREKRAVQSQLFKAQQELSSLRTQLSETKRELERQTSLKNSALGTIEDQQRKNASFESQLSEAQKDRDAYKNQAAELRELIVGQAHKSQD